MPKMMVIRLVQDKVMWLNSFPRKGGISKLSNRALMDGVKLDYKLHCRTEIGQYVQTHEDHPIKNNMKDRTLGAICLGPTGNAQGTHVFLNLNTGRRITRTSWDEIPITQTVINRVLELGAHEKAQA